MTVLKKIGKSVLRPLVPRSWRLQARLMGWRKWLTYFLFQRILRANSSVPWPVHWASSVSSPRWGRLDFKTDRRFPGYMPGQYIQAMNGIVLGNNVLMGPGVKLISASHNLCDYDVHDPADPIVIGDNCWLAADVIVLPGVRLGNHVVVAAGSVVTKSFAENDILIAGVPARVIRKLGPYVGKSRPAPASGEPE
ncbi:MAG: acyltransferase [bacterium]